MNDLIHFNIKKKFLKFKNIRILWQVLESELLVISKRIY